MSTLHIYSSESIGDDAYIIGTEEELKKLIHAIQNSLNGNNSSLISSDSEGRMYTINVVKENKKEILEHLLLPYTSSYSKDKRDNVIQPSEVNN